MPYEALKILAIIPARGGSKGFPMKNIRSFAGLPLIAHSILFARLCPEIDRCIVSTDSPEIARVAKDFGADLPFVRPRELAEDGTPLWGVLRHALMSMEAQEGSSYDALLLLDPTSPGREPADLRAMCRRLAANVEADGVISVAKPPFNPIWHCVVEKEGWMENLLPEGTLFDRRQDLPLVYRIDGSLYLWRTRFVRQEPVSWRRGGRYLLHEIPDLRAWSIDTEEQFEVAELLVKNGKVSLPWLTQVGERCAP